MELDGFSNESSLDHPWQNFNELVVQYLSAGHSLLRCAELSEAILADCNVVSTSGQQHGQERKSSS
jgi:hypothetical protein